MNTYNSSPGFDPRKFRVIFISIIAVVVLLIFISKTFVILEPTERGVLFKRYTTGLDKETVYTEGLNIVAPWNEMIRYDISEQKLEETMDVLSSNGLSIAVDVAVRFAPTESEIGALYESFKADYIDRLVRSELRSAVRKIIGRYTPEELYSSKRDVIEGEMKELITEILNKNHVQLRALLIRSVKLPESIQRAIEDKLNQEQQSLAYIFRLEKEESEAERKRIQAEGEARANAIINNSLTNELLKMRGIEATTQLANSPNSKVVVIGSGKDGLPLILGGN